METAMLILSILAMAVSVSAIVFSWVLYNKSDNLYKEMRDFILEIKTITAKLYPDTFGLLKFAVEKSLSQRLHEDSKLVDDKSVNEIITRALNEVDEKLSSEIERLESGEKLREEEIGKLKKEVKKIVARIPKEFDHIKVAQIQMASGAIERILETQPGLQNEALVEHSSLEIYDTSTIINAYIGLVRTGKIAVRDNRLYLQSD